MKKLNKSRAKLCYLLSRSLNSREFNDEIIANRILDELSAVSLSIDERHMYINLRGTVFGMMKNTDDIRKMMESKDFHDVFGPYITGYSNKFSSNSSGLPETIGEMISDTMTWSPKEFKGSEILDKFMTFQILSKKYDQSLDTNMYKMVERFNNTYFTGTRVINNDSYYYLVYKEKSDKSGKMIIPIKLHTLCKRTLRELIDTSVVCDQIVVQTCPSKQIYGAELIDLMNSQLAALSLFIDKNGISCDKVPVQFAHLLEAWIVFYNEYYVSGSIDTSKLYRLTFNYPHINEICDKPVTIDITELN